MWTRPYWDTVKESYLKCLLKFLRNTRKIPDGQSLLAESLDVPLDGWHIRGSGERFISTVHIEDHKIEAHFASVVKNNLSNCCLIKQLKEGKMITTVGAVMEPQQSCGYSANRWQFSVVYTLTNHKMTSKMSKTQVSRFEHFMASFYGLFNNYSTSARWIWDDR